MPATTLPNVVAYEDWLAEADGDFAWAAFDENAAAGMCYTSGTTGDPKGVLYSHRSNFLHTLMAAMPDAMGISSRETSCPWCRCSTPTPGGLRLRRAVIGAKLVMPGGKMDGASIYELLETEKVTFSAAVPTVWLMLLQHLEETGKSCPISRRWSSAARPAARRDREFAGEYGVEVIHAWGMTEMSPLGTLAR